MMDKKNFFEAEKWKILFYVIEYGIMYPYTQAEHQKKYKNDCF